MRVEKLDISRVVENRRVKPGIVELAVWALGWDKGYATATFEGDNHVQIEGDITRQEYAELASAIAYGPSDGRCRPHTGGFGWVWTKEL